MNRKWYISLAVFVAIYANCFLLKQIGMPGILTSYVADVLSLPVVLTIILLVVRRLYKSPQYNLSMAMIFMAFIYEVLLFEMILPRWSHRFVYDPFDIAAYATGGLLFFCLQIVFRKNTIVA